MITSKIVITGFWPLKLLSLLQQSRGKHACSDGVCQTPRGLAICYSKTIRRETENTQYLGPTVEFNPLTYSERNQNVTNTG